MVWSTLALKWPISVPFCGMDHQKFNFSLIFFLLEAVEAILCHFFENWLMKHKIPNLLKHLGTIIHQNSQFYYPSESFSFHHFNVRHPVLSNLGFFMCPQINSVNRGMPVSCCPIILVGTRTIEEPHKLERWKDWLISILLERWLIASRLS